METPEGRFVDEAKLGLRERWIDLSLAEKIMAFESLSRAEADDFFLSLKAREQAQLLAHLESGERRIWARLLPPDDLADLIQEADAGLKELILSDLDSAARMEVQALLAYEEDEAGGLMNPRFVRVRPEMRVDEAIRYMRKQATHAETTRYLYVLDHDQHLLGVVSLRGLFAAEGQKSIAELMRRNIISAQETMSGEDMRHLFSQSALMAVPVVNEAGQMKGIVTVDDIVDVLEVEATEDIHKLGGSEAFEAPYLQVSLREMVRKRGVWLVVLFLGEMLTATAMAYFQDEIARAVVLALFIPLIISSGGNSGSQASTIVVRAMALRELKPGDWFKVFKREILVGMSLGLMLGAVGALRIMAWPLRVETYGEHYMLIALTVALSLVGVVLWGSLTGSMLPFAMRKFKIDPASASAPFVATMVDVMGLVIYFMIASSILKGTLL